MRHKIGILSDTHGLLRPEIVQALQGCEAILHGGDINKQKLLDELEKIAPIYAVRGNNDKEWAEKLPETLTIELFGVHIFMVHNKKKIPVAVSQRIMDGESDIDIIVYGHSHKYEEKRIGAQLWLNPGSCGPRRFTQPVTMALLEIEEGGVFHVEKFEFSFANPNPGAQLTRQTVISIMREVERGKTVEEIAAKCKVKKELAEQICRLYLTHPGVDADGILGKMGL